MALDDVIAAARDLISLRAAVAETRARRDAAIRQSFADGVPIGDIAKAANLTPARVSGILGHPFQRVGRPPRSTTSRTGSVAEQPETRHDDSSSDPQQS